MYAIYVADGTSLLCEYAIGWDEGMCYTFEGTDGEAGCCYWVDGSGCYGKWGNEYCWINYDTGSDAFCSNIGGWADACWLAYPCCDFNDEDGCFAFDYESECPFPSYDWADSFRDELWNIWVYGAASNECDYDYDADWICDECGNDWTCAWYMYAIYQSEGTDFMCYLLLEWEYDYCVTMWPACNWEEDWGCSGNFGNDYVILGYGDYYDDETIDAAFLDTDSWCTNQWPDACEWSGDACVYEADTGCVSSGTYGWFPNPDLVWGLKEQWTNEYYGGGGCEEDDTWQCYMCGGSDETCQTYMWAIFQWDGTSMLCESSFGDEESCNMWSPCCNWQGNLCAGSMGYDYCYVGSSSWGSTADVENDVWCEQMGACEGCCGMAAPCCEWSGEDQWCYPTDEAGCKIPNPFWVDYVHIDWFNEWFGQMGWQAYRLEVDENCDEGCQWYVWVVNNFRGSALACQIIIGEWNDNDEDKCEILEPCCFYDDDVGCFSSQGNNNVCWLGGSHSIDGHEWCNRQPTEDFCWASEYVCEWNDNYNECEYVEDREGFFPSPYTQAWWVEQLIWGYWDYLEEQYWEDYYNEGWEDDYADQYDEDYYDEGMADVYEEGDDEYYVPCDVVDLYMNAAGSRIMCQIFIGYDIDACYATWPCCQWDDVAFECHGLWGDDYCELTAADDFCDGFPEEGCILSYPCCAWSDEFQSCNRANDDCELPSPAWEETIRDWLDTEVIEAYCPNDECLERCQNELCEVDWEKLASADGTVLMCEIIIGENQQICELFDGCCSWNPAAELCINEWGDDKCLVNEDSDDEFCERFDGEFCQYLYPCCMVDSYYGYCVMNDDECEVPNSDLRKQWTRELDDYITESCIDEDGDNFCVEECSLSDFSARSEELEDIVGDIIAGAQSSNLLMFSIAIIAIVLTLI